MEEGKESSIVRVVIFVELSFPEDVGWDWNQLGTD